MLAANFRDGAASWYHAKVMVEHVTYTTLDELHAALTAEFVPPDQQFRLRAELRQCKQRGSVDDFVKDFRRLMAQIHGMHPLDQVDHFCEGLKSETKKEVMYLRCATLADAIAAAQAYERTHFSGDRSRSAGLQPSRGAGEGATPMDLSVVDSRQIDKRTCRERNLCFYCKESGHRIASCPRKKGPGGRTGGQGQGVGQGNGLARRTTPFIKTVYIADKPLRMLIDSGASHCILKDGVMDTTQMPIIQVSARGFDGGAQQRLVPTCDLTVDCDSVICRVPFIFWPMTYDYDGILGRPWLEQCNPVIDWASQSLAFPGSNADQPAVPPFLRNEELSEVTFEDFRRRLEAGEYAEVYTVETARHEGRHPVAAESAISPLSGRAGRTGRVRRGTTKEGLD
ncbi:unnamed protein product [Phytophthora fragariaefolia]|uniref:Unnamed protein product n=1 Tax=Phytophthora fragariaefolia TaxID=1490495 RepID=A0A9W6WT13_9STRA|nr:unnamed protein product [Phytophthora fragariaefolia]